LIQEHFEKVVKDRTAEQFKKFKGMHPIGHRRMMFLFMIFMLLKIVPFFENFPADRLRELAGLCVLQKYDPGAVLFREGRSSPTFLYPCTLIYVIMFCR
jgi:hypothetical protein